MSLSAILLPEFDQEMAKTRTALERIPPDRFDWAPHEKSMSFGDLATHLANIPNWGNLTLEQDSFDLEPPGGESTQISRASDLSDVLASFDTAVPRARASIEATTDDQWQEEWTLLHSGEPLFSLPRAVVVRNMVMNHLIHHRGQLSVYLRLAGVPVPALYGGSADEEMGAR